MTLPPPDWAPFVLSEGGARGDPPRSIDTAEGIGDRLRTAAFAELQAREAFHWAAGAFADTPEELRRSWSALSVAEDRHLGWLIARMRELGVDVRARRVSDFLWKSLQSCKTGREFAVFIATAEERGRKAGARFHEAMMARDPVTAEIFGRIAEEEVAHVALAQRFYPDADVVVRAR